MSVVNAVAAALELEPRNGAYFPAALCKALGHADEALSPTAEQTLKELGSHLRAEARVRVAAALRKPNGVAAAELIIDALDELRLEYAAELDLIVLGIDHLRTVAEHLPYGYEPADYNGPEERDAAEALAATRHGTRGNLTKRSAQLCCRLLEKLAGRERTMTSAVLIACSRDWDFDVSMQCHRKLVEAETTHPDIVSWLVYSLADAGFPGAAALLEAWADSPNPAVSRAAKEWLDSHRAATDFVMGVARSTKDGFAHVSEFAEVCLHRAGPIEYGAREHILRAAECIRWYYGRMEERNGRLFVSSRQ